MKSEAGKADRETPRPLEEDKDFYFEKGLMVLTERYLLERGFCCRNACRHCPYGFHDDG
jgi:hypothetical protein